MADFAAFSAAVRRWQNKQTQVVTEVGRGLSAAAFNYIVEISPQYSGDFAANWKYSLGTPDTSFTPDVLTFKGVVAGGFMTSDRTVGDPEAINYAYARNVGKDSTFTLASKAFISNSAVHDEPYAWKIDEGTIKFIAPNEGHVRARTIEHLTAKYGFVPLTPVQVAELQRTRVGVAGGWV
jgi:hypothetical protein